MDAYTAYMAEQIAREIREIENPIVLSIYLKAIIGQRCKIGGAKEGTCKECLFQSHYCRELYNINADELRIFSYQEESK